MALRDLFGGRRRDKRSTLPRGAKVARRRRQHGSGSDVGYWQANQFYLLDGTLTDSYEYVGGPGDTLRTPEARIELEREGYDADSYTAPASTSTSSDSYVGNTGSGKSDYSYDGGSTGYYGGSSSGSDSGYSSGSSYGSPSSDSGSSYGGSSSSSSYDSGSSSSSSSSDY